VKCGVPCAPYAVIETAEQLAAVNDALLPGILKTARMGYDGKGQIRVKTRDELVKAWSELKQVACVLEKCCRWRMNARSSWRAAAMATSSTCPCSAICTATAFWP
jgi:phosphoribosylaminoimidazole carboxylase (NCAIR synthetase)